MKTAAGPIAVIDSGLGGLTVADALRKALPAEDLIYFGDTAHLPYGNKSPATVAGFVRQIIQFLSPMKPKHVVIACNTATALCLPTMVAEFPEISVSGVIEPGARAAVVAAGAKPVPTIGIIATEATVRSKAYGRAILQRRSMAQVLLRATPLLVPMIEEGRSSDDPVVDLALRQYLQGMISRKLDVLVLGCTHYPLVKKAIARVMGNKVRLIDSAEQCAQDVALRLRRKHLLREVNVNASGEVGSFQSFVTDDPDRFATLAARFLRMKIRPPVLVEPRDLYILAAPAPWKVSA
jgi:glutamate racemase